MAWTWLGAHPLMTKMWSGSAACTTGGLLIAYAETAMPPATAAEARALGRQRRLKTARAAIICQNGGTASKLTRGAQADVAAVAAHPAPTTFECR